jgi:hypothetical protein
LAPSDFFLFGYVKGKLMGYRSETPSKLLVRIRVILAEIPRETLNAVFFEWMEGLQKCVQVDGEYVGLTKRTQYIEIDFTCEIRLCYTWRGTPYTITAPLTVSHPESLPSAVSRSGQTGGILLDDEMPQRLDLTLFLSVKLLNTPQNLIDSGAQIDDQISQSFRSAFHSRDLDPSNR